MFERLDMSPSINVHPFDEEVLKLVPDTLLKELHDRIIVATCTFVKATKLITKDEEIARSGIVRTLW
jgi:predicted nucleic acid-binding protein